MAQGGKQRVDDIAGLIGDGKDTVAPLSLQGNAQPLKECLGAGGGKGGHSAVKEFAITGDVGQSLVHGAVVGEVAAALSGDV